MSLKFSVEGSMEKYKWYCTDIQNCDNRLEYISPTNRFDYANDDPSEILNSMSSLSEKEKNEIRNEINVQMSKILRHFIECTWGAHYNTLFNKIIKPYLNDPKVLDHVLRTAITSKGNVVMGNTGATIYPELHSYLIRVDNSDIRKYLANEFKEALGRTNK